MTHLTADICDTHGEAARVIDGLDLRFGNQMAFSGQAFPIRLYGPDKALADLLKTSGVGRVAVVSVDHGGGRAVFGEGMARDAAANGWAGVIIDGAVRDVATFDGRNIGIAARAVHPAIVRDGDAGLAADNVTISGVSVSHKDTIICDADGIVAIDSALLG